MRAIVIHEFGPIENHKVEDWPDPEIGPDAQIDSLCQTAAT